MASLHDIVTANWCPICSCLAPGGKCGRHGKCATEGHVVPLMRAGIFERLPKCVPEGLEWYDWNGLATWSLRAIRVEHRGLAGRRTRVTDEQAELMCKGRWEDVLAESGDAKPLEIRIGSGGVSVRGPTQDEWSVGPSVLHALAVALHRLAAPATGLDAFSERQGR